MGGKGGEKGAENGGKRDKIWGGGGGKEGEENGRKRGHKMA